MCLRVVILQMRQRVISAAAFALLYKQVCVSFVPAHRLRLDFSARCLRMLAFFKPILSRTRVDTASGVRCQTNSSPRYLTESQCHSKQAYALFTPIRRNMWMSKCKFCETRPTATTTAFISKVRECFYGSSKSGNRLNRQSRKVSE